MKNENVLAEAFVPCRWSWKSSAAPSRWVVRVSSGARKGYNNRLRFCRSPEQAITERHGGTRGLRPDYWSASGMIMMNHHLLLLPIVLE